ncbi:geranylgeranyl pyrophosphate synthetase [Hirsutella rhossiliensis]
MFTFDNVEGIAPTWRNIPLPVTLPRDRGTFFIDQNSARVPRHPLEPLFRAAASTNPDFRFNDVDVVSDRSSLRKLLNFCADRSDGLFRLKLTLVHNSLLIERWERSSRERTTGALVSGYGHNFERAFTDYPPRVGDSTGHHRVLLYPLGHLRCAVRFEVDACYNGPGSAKSGAKANVSQVVRRPSIKCGPRTASTNTQVTSTASDHDMAMPQSAAAEVKTAGKYKSSGTYLPQLWFGRTPWLIVGRHVDGTFTNVTFNNVAAEFTDWETRQQVHLQKLVTVLVRLKEVVRRNGARACVAICERGLRPRIIKIFAAKEDAKALPDDLIAKFWT